MLKKCQVILWILILSLCSSFEGIGQQTNYLPFFSQDSSEINSLAISHRHSLKKAFKLPEGVNKEYRKNFLALAEGMSESIYNTIRYGALLDTVINPYMQTVFNKVLDANKNLPAARMVLVRNPVENAYALGDGTILFNVGLLSKLENESQIAFVICHELAHIYFRHMQQGVKEHFGSLYNKEFQKEYKKVLKEEYNRYAKFNSLMQNVSLNKLYHKRTHEKQADSLGYVLLSKTTYDLSQAYRALQLLDRIDEPYSDDEIDFKSHFGCPQAQHLFKAKPKKSASIFAVEPEKPGEFELSDTLKTHPDCKSRMQFIQDLGISHSPEKKRAVSGQAQFEYIKSISRIEVIQSWYDARRYDRALFEALLFMQEDRGNPYLHSISMLCLYELKDHLKNHLYADVVARVSDYYPGNFNQLLEHLHQLNLSDFEKISSCFQSHHPLVHSSGEYGLAASFAYYSLINEQSVADKEKEKYMERYAQGRLKASLFE